MNAASTDLWDFTLAAYRRDGVSPAVIGLQERRGADVNLLFLCCWSGATGRGASTRADLERAEAAVLAWRENVTRPLRAVRDTIKNHPGVAALPDAMEVRKKVLAAEIDSERVAQLAMQAVAPPPGSGSGQPLTDAARGLATYAAMLAMETDGEDRGALATLLTGTFAEHARTAIDEALAAALA